MHGCLVPYPLVTIATPTVITLIIRTIQLFQHPPPFPGEFTCVYTSLASRPMSVIFGLGMTLCVHMRTKLENGILSNGQQPQSTVNGFC